MLQTIRQLGKFFCAGVLTSLVAAQALAQTPPVASGVYATPGGAAEVTIGPWDQAKKAASFELFQAGPNYHSCNISSTVRPSKNGTATVSEEKCTLTVKPQGSAIHIMASGNGCGDFCGARASLQDMTYAAVPAQCSGKQQQATRDRFKPLYQKKQYPQAAQLLSPLLAQCGKYMDDAQAAWVRNDLAITQFHMKDKDACLATLQPLTPIATKTEKELEEQFGTQPSVYEDWKPIIKATRTNLKLCGSTSKFPPLGAKK